MKIVNVLNIPCLTYGLRVDFTAEPFEGSKYLLALAHELVDIELDNCGPLFAGHLGHVAEDLFNLMKVQHELRASEIVHLLLEVLELKACLPRGVDLVAALGLGPVFGLNELGKFHQTEGQELLRGDAAQSLQKGQVFKQVVRL